MVEESQFATGGRDGEADDLDLGGMWRALVRRKRWIVCTTALSLLAALAFDVGVAPRFTADSQVLIENQQNFFAHTEAAVSPEAPPDDAAVASQIQLLTSRDLARQAIAKLGLDHLTEFNPHARPGLTSRLFALFGLRGSQNAINEEDAVLQNYYDRLNVYQVAKSRVLAIEFTSHDPELAAQAANLIGDLYIDVQISAKRQDAKSAAVSLGQQIALLQKQLSDVEDRAESFRASNGFLVGANNTTLSGQQLAEINTQLSAARAAQADAAAKARLIRESVGQGRLDDISEIAANDLVRQISVQRVALRSQLASLSKTLLPRHPQILALQAQLSDVDTQLKSAATTAARGLENDARVAEARSENLQATLDQQKRAVGDMGANEVRMRELDRNAKALSDQLDATNTEYQEALARQTATSMPGDARVISRAIAPELPSFPHKVPTAIFATLAGLVFSAAAAVAAELLSDGGRRSTVPRRDERGDHGMRDADAGDEDADGEDADDEVAIGDRPERAIEEQAAPRIEPRPAFAEVREAHWMLKPFVQKAAAIFHASDRAACLLVVGLDADEPVGVAAVELARALAVEGRTMLVELAPGLLSAAGLIPSDMFSNGLGELVDGGRSFAEVIDRDDESRMHFIVAGSVPTQAGEQLDIAIEALGKTYDFLVLLGPPLDTGALTRELAGAADVVALIGGESKERIEDLRLKFLRIGAGEVLPVQERRSGGRFNAA